MHPSDPGDPADDDLGPTSPAAPRQWMHPSEVAMQARDQHDRARPRRRAAVGFVLLGGAIVAVGVVLGWGWVSTGGPTEQIASRPDGLVALTLVSAQGTSSGSGVVVGDESHVAVRASALEPDTQVWVTPVGSEPQLAALVGRDDAMDVAVLVVRIPVGRPGELAAEPTVGEELVVAQARGAEQPPTQWMADVRATDVGGAQRGTESGDMFLTEGHRSLPGASAGATLASTTAAAPARTLVDGVVFDRRGRFAGLVVSQRTATGELLVVPSRSVADTVTRAARVTAPTAATGTSTPTQPGG
ncbi:MAG: hypothetical protein ACOYML_01370 [Microthrixaceae bacterium]|jgi:hypothetical protein